MNNAFGIRRRYCDVKSARECVLRACVPVYIRAAYFELHCSNAASLMSHTGPVSVLFTLEFTLFIYFVLSLSHFPFFKEQINYYRNTDCYLSLDNFKFPHNCVRFNSVAASPSRPRAAGCSLIT